MEEPLYGTFGNIKIINYKLVKKSANNKKFNKKIQSEANTSIFCRNLLKKYNINLKIPKIYDVNDTTSKNFFTMDRIYPSLKKKNIISCIFWRFEDTIYDENWKTEKLNQLFINEKKILKEFSYNLGLFHCALINNGIVPWEMEIIYGHLYDNDDYLFCLDFDKWGSIDFKNKYQCSIKGFDKLNIYNLLIQECYPLPSDKDNWDCFCKGMYDFTKKYRSIYTKEDISDMIKKVEKKIIHDEQIIEKV